MNKLIKYCFFSMLIFILGCNQYTDKHSFAEVMIDKVEHFKKTHGRLPKNESEFGQVQKLDNLAFYLQESDSIYKVWYGLSIGKSNVYRSNTKKWTVEGN